jgi:uncharacterized phage protein (TIGR01671 family)
MSREIKFRLWVDGKMHYGHKACAVPEFTSSWGWTKRDKFVLQQFTGLLDKNGREIYEGDVVKDGNAQTYEIIYSNKGSFDLEVCGENILSGLSYATQIYESKYIEIVGNSFESPELLTR